MDENDLPLDELIGLNVKIKNCRDPGWIGKSGLILDETKNTFLIKINEKEKKIAKKTAIFEFELSGKKITLDGSKIVYKPEDRIKKVRWKNWQKKK